MRPAIRWTDLESVEEARQWLELRLARDPEAPLLVYVIAQTLDALCADLASKRDARLDA